MRGNYQHLHPGFSLHECLHREWSARLVVLWKSSVVHDDADDYDDDGADGSGTCLTHVHRSQLHGSTPRSALSTRRNDVVYRTCDAAIRRLHPQTIPNYIGSSQTIPGARVWPLADILITYPPALVDEVTHFFGSALGTSEPHHPHATHTTIIRWASNPREGCILFASRIVSAPWSMTTVARGGGDSTTFNATQGILSSLLLPPGGKEVISLLTRQSSMVPCHVPSSIRANSLPLMHLNRRRVMPMLIMTCPFPEFPQALIRLPDILRRPREATS